MNQAWKYKLQASSSPLSTEREVCHVLSPIKHEAGVQVDQNRDKWWKVLLGPPVVPFGPFLGEGSPAKIGYRKKGYRFSNLSTGGPRLAGG